MSSESAFVLFAIIPTPSSLYFYCIIPSKRIGSYADGITYFRLKQPVFHPFRSVRKDFGVKSGSKNNQKTHGEFRRELVRMAFPHHLLVMCHFDHKCLWSCIYAGKSIFHCEDYHLGLELYYGSCECYFARAVLV